MGTTQPIRDLKELKELENYYYETKQNLRNYAMICLGVNCVLRISDLLQLRWGDVYDFSSEKYRYHIVVKEHKTEKWTRIALNKNAVIALDQYKKSLPPLQTDSYLFPGKKGFAPLSRSQAYRIIRHASENLNLDKHISCHSLRKTFGYHAWKNGVSPVVLMDIYNHSSFHVTKRYLGLEQEDKDSVFLQINL
ncbi:MAG: tyrosine-type recombinase/integrase [Lachnospiraceae bacterium]|nr:tyrosine-type recombinase/integrase [Lachnospiraceae bacterium]